MYEVENSTTSAYINFLNEGVGRIRVTDVQRVEVLLVLGIVEVVVVLVIDVCWLQSRGHGQRSG